MYQLIELLSLFFFGMELYGKYIYIFYSLGDQAKSLYIYFSIMNVQATFLKFVLFYIYLIIFFIFSKI